MFFLQMRGLIAYRLYSTKVLVMRVADEDEKSHADIEMLFKNKNFRHSISFVQAIVQ